jgi:hypothetical protein
MSDDKMLAEFEAWANANAVKPTQFEIWKAAYQAGQKAADEQIEELQLILREVLENDSYESLHNNNNLDDELKQRIEAAIGCKPEGEQ